MPAWSVCIMIFLCYSVSSLNAKHTILPNQVLGENESLVSAGGVFELGFFQGAVSGDVFAGIWFKNLVNKKPVWVANRDNPLQHRYATLAIRYDGNLIVSDRRQAPMIVNYGMLASSPNTSATLLDNGNLILKQRDEVIWQSFSFPTDTYLPGMKLGWFGLTTEEPRRQVLLSWLSPQNPAWGSLTMVTSYKDARTLSVWKGDSAHLDIGWLDENGRFRFVFENSSDSFNLSHTSTANETYLTYNTIGGYDMSWLVMASTGHLDEYKLYEGRLSIVRHPLCGGASVTVNSSVCSKEASQKCEDGDAFVVINGSMPSSISMNISIVGDLDECELICRINCSCIAFASGESGCQLYYGSRNDLLNNIGGGGFLHLRGNETMQKQGGTKRRLKIILISIIAPVIVAVVVAWGYQRRKRCICRVNQHGDHSRRTGEVKLIADQAKTATNIDMSMMDYPEFSREDQRLTWFSISTMEKTTGNFDSENKIGEGGFGAVYKGKLPNGQEIAVKRLSKSSVQGVREFRNEVILISRLQHRNLVRLLGCCIQGEEYILVYEYLINRSLDSFIFDEYKQKLLDWKTRIKIIEGIAQGVLYLHKYSRLRIIHRDLKTSNILLDGDMNPKVSDFGLARICGENEARAKTTKIAGTYGYMSPEYAMDGRFSEKSDVFSFGIIVLEIISGKRNISFFEADHSLNLLGYAWKLWKEEKSDELLESTLAKSYAVAEAARYVQLGLICVQERAQDRPTMWDVVAMVRTADVASLPQPKQPAFLG